MKFAQHKGLVSTMAIAMSAGLLGLAGCQSAPKDSAALTQAREAVSKAESDPNVTRYSPTELDRARKLLMNAEGSAKENGPTDKVVTHYAYLATQVARIAMATCAEQCGHSPV